MPVSTKRASLPFANLSERFLTPKSDYSKQYCRIYTVRLNEMRHLLEERIKHKWGTDYTISRLHTLSETTENCIIIGTIFKDQKLKPSVLKQLAESNHLLPQPVHDHLWDESDVLYIEDELQRIQLIGDIVDKERLVTGVSCAFLGRNLGRGKFEMEDYCFVDYRQQIERPKFDVDYYVLFVSGMNLKDLSYGRVSLQLFIDWLAGITESCGGTISPRNVVRLVVAGNTNQADMEQSASFSLSKKLESDKTIESVKLMDTVLRSLLQIVDVDLMPGEFDPSNHILPQQKIHSCVLPKSVEFKSLQRVTNPYECSVGGVRILGTSGQPVSNVMKYCGLAEPLDVLEECLKWNHLAPTAPDTLGCFPHYKTDPFIIRDCPHVFFAGNQKEFSTRTCIGENNAEVRLISIPQFYKSTTVVALNLRSLNCVPIIFP